MPKIMTEWLRNLGIKLKNVPYPKTTRLGMLEMMAGKQREWGTRSREEFLFSMGKISEVVSLKKEIY